MLGNNLSFLVSVDVLLFDIVLYLVCHTSEDLSLWMMLKVVPGMSREFMAYGKYPPPPPLQTPPPCNLPPPTRETVTSMFF